MATIYAINPNASQEQGLTTFDALPCSEPLGYDEVQRRLAAAVWLPPYFAWQWPGGGEDPCDNAFAAAARVVVMAAVLNSRAPQDIADGLGLSTMFVRVVLTVLESVGWQEDVLPELTRLTTGDVDVKSVKDAVDDLVINRFPADVNFLAILAMISPEL